MNDPGNIDPAEEYGDPLNQACVDHGCEPGEDCLAGCLCGRCDDERSDNGPRFGEAQ